MAFATSEISARVGRGLTIMLSSIWVAVTMGLPKEKERSMMSFWMRQLGEVDLNAQVTTGHHDGIGCGEDAVDVVHTLAVLDFGNDTDVGIVLIEQVADVVHILCGAHKGSSDEVKAVLHAKDDVLAVFLAQVRAWTDARRAH